VRLSTYPPGNMVVTSLPVTRCERLAFLQGHSGARALCNSSSHVLSVRTRQRAVCKARCPSESVSHTMHRYRCRTVSMSPQLHNFVYFMGLGRVRADSECRNAAGILVVYDMTDRASFDRAIRWLTELPSTMPADTVLVLVGAYLAWSPSNKLDPTSVIKSPPKLAYVVSSLCSALLKCLSMLASLL
jgi:hypothetical protein